MEKNNIMKFINYKNDDDDDDENYLEKEIEKKRIVKRLNYKDERNEWKRKLHDYNKIFRVFFSFAQKKTM